MWLIEWSVLTATLVGLLLGGFCIYWVHVRPSQRRAQWGRRLFVGTLLGLGAMAVVAALARADGLAPLGLLSGLLTVAMLWESPVSALPDESV